MNIAAVLVCTLVMCSPPLGKSVPVSAAFQVPQQATLWSAKKRCPELNKAECAQRSKHCRWSNRAGRCVGK